MIKNMKLKNRPSAVFLFLCVVMTVVIVFLVAWVMDLERAEFFSYRVGNFVYWTNSKEVSIKGKNGEIVQSRISLIDDKEAYQQSPCSTVSGVHNLNLFGYIVANSKLYGNWKNVVSLKSWNIDQLKFANDRAKTYYLKKIEALSSLERYAENGEIFNTALDNPNVDITIRPWMYGDSCGGWASIPVYGAKIVQNEYDIALYIEALEHQDVPLTSQLVRFLVVKKNNDWIIIEADGDIDEEEFRSDIKSCSGSKDTTDQYRCIGNIYLTKYQNGKSISWAKRNLEAINYSPIY